MINFSSGRLLLRKVTTIVSAAPADLDFRADLAGLLIVSFVSSYENAVKKILIIYADSHNEQFSFFVEKQFDKINSKISLGDLRSYAKKFDEVLEQKFDNELLRVKQRLGGQPVETWYEQLLQWRHAFAHAGQRMTTIEEVFKAHQFAKYVLFAFYKAFSETSPTKKTLAETIFNDFLEIKAEGQNLFDDSIYISNAAPHPACTELLEKIRQTNIELSKLYSQLKKQKRVLDFHGMRSSLSKAKNHVSGIKENSAAIYTLC